ncbi:DUF3013 family protein [Streptococcaceae bacterium ESL0687]|nr:DUF3013 family protein [Streptococcaceae bacterium ESL0687]
MAKLDFLDVLDSKLDKNFPYDYQINWDKKNHAVEVAFLLDAENKDGITIVDSDDVESSDNIIYEDAIVLVNPTKSKVDPEDYLAVIPYGDKGLSLEFIDMLVGFLTEVAHTGLDDLMDFLADPEAEEFFLKFDTEDFNKQSTELVETEFYKYPRY